MRPDFVSQSKPRWPVSTMRFLAGAALWLGCLMFLLFLVNRFLSLLDRVRWGR